MSQKTAAVARTIGIDTGKNTLHLIGLDDKGAIVLREKVARGRITARLANVPRCSRHLGRRPVTSGLPCKRMSSGPVAMSQNGMDRPCSRPEPLRE